MNSNEFCVYLKKDFGAKGDGETDDTLSVHNFLNYLAMNGGVGIVEPGVYNSGSYRLNNNNVSFSVIGSSPVDCLFKNLSGGSFFTFNQCSGIRIDGVSIDCQYTKSRAKMHGLIFVSSTNCTVNNCCVYDYLGSGIIAYSNSEEKCRKLIIKNCYTQAKTAYQEWQNASDENKKSKECNGIVLADCEYSKIIGCSAENISLFGIELKNYSTWNFVLNCSAKDCKYGFGMGQQTTDDTGCECNIISGFLAEDCYMGGIIGKAKGNNIKNFVVDFNNVPERLIQNAFRFQLNSSYNSLDNLNVLGISKDRGVVRYESGASNNTVTIVNCKQRAGDYNLIVSEYYDSSQGTTGNYTVLMRSNAARNNIITGASSLVVTGDALSFNKTWYDWDKVEINNYC
ncbi:TPA: hypothetical protein ACYZ04_002984 [Escherichia coli]|uniref:hypothetical protein n=1 Tax=Escherichia coli TaxID=562 RepID=UPI0005A9C8D7|nr:hypothetical protein [Escherichia coli]EEV6842028.1 hypothetical protein [Escherichia coli]EFH5757537.1 hypothetical protein [Escherichia coli]EFH5817917.1 hypothetical protein [Escherichia coli]EFJ3714766.1 hypothetical protein [Escherichia coli]EFJ3818187.1 hypothetical protein [Escherichia coli]